MATLIGFGSLAGIPEEKITDKITRRVLAGEKGMMVSWNIKSGTHVAAHSHPHEQIVWMIKGKLRSSHWYRAPRDQSRGRRHNSGRVEHEIWFHEDTELVDIFVPPREDFLAGGGPPGYATKKAEERQPV